MLKLRGKELWLVTGSIPVPEYLWKLVVDTVSGDSIVFVTLNNPHLPYLTSSVTLCKDLCQEARWGTSSERGRRWGKGSLSAATPYSPGCQRWKERRYYCSN